MSTFDRPPGHTRRSVLRSLAFGGIAVGLPSLESLTPRRAVAGGSVATRPDRLVIFHFPNGALMSDWTPEALGDAYVMGEQLSPLSDLREHFAVVTGLSLTAGAEEGSSFGTPHGIPNCTFLSGAPARSGGACVTAPTIDQLAASYLGATTPIRSTNTCQHRGSGSSSFKISWAGSGTATPIEIDPIALFDRIFTVSTPDAVDAIRARRRSILDFVRGDAVRLRARLGAVDRPRLDEHLDAIRALEVRLGAFSSSLASCESPVAPAPHDPADKRAQLDLLTDVSLLAQRCGSTAVSLVSTGQTQNVEYYLPGQPDHNHNLSHLNAVEVEDEADATIRREANDRWMKDITRYHMERFARLLRTLVDTPDPAGTLLDRTLVVCLSELSWGDIHSGRSLPVLVAGGGLRGGRHVHFPCNSGGHNATGRIVIQRLGVCAEEVETNTPIANLWLTVMNALGDPRESVGDSTGTLSDLWI
jgi:hypothetical protein